MKRFVSVVLASVLGIHASLAQINPSSDPIVVGASEPSGIAVRSESAVAPDGSFAVAWTGVDPDGSQGAFVRFYDTAGNPLTGAVTISPITSGKQIVGGVDSDGAGNYAVVFNTGGNYFVQRYQNGGTPIGASFMVNVSVAFPNVSTANHSHIALDQAGNMVVTYVGVDGTGASRAYFRRFDAAGNPLDASDVLLPNPTGGSSSVVHADMIESGPLQGSFAITWFQSVSSDAFVQAFNADGTPVGPEEQLLGPPGAAFEGLPEVALADDGEFAVAFMRTPSGPAGFDVYVQRFDASGDKRGAAFLVHDNAFTVADTAPSIVDDGTGALIVTWTSASEGNGNGVLGQAFDSNDQPVGPQFLVNTETNGNQGAQSVSINASGDFVVSFRDAPTGTIQVRPYDPIAFGPAPDGAVVKFAPPLRPGFLATFTIYVTNRGTTPLTGVTVTDTLPLFTQFTFLTADPPQDSFDLFRVQWTNVTIPGRQTRVFRIEGMVDPSVQIGDEIANEVSITADNDSDPSNDTYLLFTYAVGSFDPNLKMVDRPRYIVGDEFLWYAIHFENLGNADAVDIRIEDQLDPRLDASTLEAVTGGGVFDPETRTITWELLDINLPPQGHGVVAFRVKPVPGLQAGDAITNSASITFDFNAPITTEPVVNVIGTPEQLDLQALVLELRRLRVEILGSGSRIDRSLAAKLSAAIDRIGSAIEFLGEGRDHLAGNQLRAASNGLGAFLQEVGAQEGKALTVEQAAEWSGRVDQVRSALSP